MRAIFFCIIRGATHETMRTYSLLIAGVILIALVFNGWRGGLTALACFAPGYLIGTYGRGRALVHEAHKRLKFGRRRYLSLEL